MSDHGIILAAGASSRMEQPKALLELDGVPLVCRAVDAVRQVGATPRVVLGAHADEIERHLDSVESVSNPDWRGGMASSLRCGVESLPDDAERALVLTVDQPDVDADLLAALLHACDAPNLASASTYPDGTLGVPACFHAQLFDALCETSGDSGARHILRSGHWPVAPVDADGRTTDVDTATQWAEYLDSRNQRGLR